MSPFNLFIVLLSSITISALGQDLATTPTISSTVVACPRQTPDDDVEDALVELQQEKEDKIFVRDESIKFVVTKRTFWGEPSEYALQGIGGNLKRHPASSVRNKIRETWTRCCPPVPDCGGLCRALENSTTPGPVTSTISSDATLRTTCPPPTSTNCLSLFSRDLLCPAQTTITTTTTSEASTSGSTTSAATTISTTTTTTTTTTTAAEVPDDRRAGLTPEELLLLRQAHTIISDRLAEKSAQLFNIDWTAATSGMSASIAALTLSLLGMTIYAVSLRVRLTKNEAAVQRARGGDVHALDNIDRNAGHGEILDEIRQTLGRMAGELARKTISDTAHRLSQSFTRSEGNIPSVFVTPSDAARAATLRRHSQNSSGTNDGCRPGNNAPLLEVVTIHKT